MYGMWNTNYRMSQQGHGSFLLYIKYYRDERHSSGCNSWFIFWRSWVQIQDPDIGYYGLGFSSFFSVSAGESRDGTSLNQDRFHPNPLKLIIHQTSLAVWSEPLEAPRPNWIE